MIASSVNQQAARTVPGVRSVHADPTTKEVRVVFEENALNEELLKQALERVGYPVAA